MLLFTDKPLEPTEAGSWYNAVAKLAEVEKQVSNTVKQLSTIQRLSVSCTYNVAKHIQ